MSTIMTQFIRVRHRKGCLSYYVEEFHLTVLHLPLCRREQRKTLGRECHGDLFNKQRKGEKMKWGKKETKKDKGLEVERLWSQDKI